MDKLTVYDEFAGHLLPSEIYTYLFLERKKLAQQDLHSISLKNCMFENVNFTETLFANSDFDSCQLQECFFENQSFQNSDIISCNFKKCTFIKVSFKGATMMNNNFENCTFISCNFNHVTMTDSTFLECTINDLNLRQSSTSLNIFTKCSWNNSQINGNFVFNLIIDSSFTNTSLDTDLLSSNFGFSENNLYELRIDKNTLPMLQQQLLNRKDLINAAIVELNTNTDIYEYSIFFCVNIIIEQIQKNIIVRSEQIKFIELVIQHLISINKISLITIIQLLSLIDSYKKFETSNISIEKAKGNINYIYNLLFKTYKDNIDELDKTLAKIEAINSKVIIKFTFKEKPLLETCDLLSNLQDQLGISAPYPVQIKTEKGSFIEWIQSPDNILKCLQLLISIIGVGVNITKICIDSKKKKKENNNSKATENKSFKQNCDNTVTLNLPDIINNQISNVQTEKDVSNVINVFVVNGMTINNGYQGFNNNNIENIECYYE